MRGSVRSGSIAAAFLATALAIGACSSGNGGTISAPPGADAGGSAPAAATSAAGETGSSGAGTASGTSTGAGARADGKVVADVCGLLSPADLKDVLGIDFPAGTPKDVSGSTATCDWESASGESSAIVSLTVEAFDEGQWAIAKKLQGSRPVSGLGDDAVFSFLNILQVKKGDRDFMIEIILMPAASTDTTDDAKLRLAKVVLPRL